MIIPADRLPPIIARYGTSIARIGRADLSQSISHSQFEYNAAVGLRKFGLQTMYSMDSDLASAVGIENPNAYGPMDAAMAYPLRPSSGSQWVRRTVTDDTSIVDSLFSLGAVFESCYGALSPNFPDDSALYAEHFSASYWWPGTTTMRPDGAIVPAAFRLFKKLKVFGPCSFLLTNHSFPLSNSAPRPTDVGYGIWEPNWLANLPAPNSAEQVTLVTGEYRDVIAAMPAVGSTPTTPGQVQQCAPTVSVIWWWKDQTDIPGLPLACTDNEYALYQDGFVPWPFYGVSAIDHSTRTGSDSVTTGTETSNIDL